MMGFTGAELPKSNPNPDPLFSYDAKMPPGFKVEDDKSGVFKTLPGLMCDSRIGAQSASNVSGFLPLEVDCIYSQRKGSGFEGEKNVSKAKKP